MNTQEEFPLLAEEGCLSVRKAGWCFTQPPPPDSAQLHQGTPPGQEEKFFFQNIT